MRGLLAIEWLKLKNFRTFWILTGFFMLLLPLWNYGISAGIMKIGGASISILNQAYSFSNVWQNMGFWTSIFVVFISILTIIITTNEYQYRTNRQNIIDGWTRLDFYHAKWQVVLALSLMTTVYVFIIGIVFGTVFGSVADFPGNIKYLFYTWVLSLNYYAFALLLSLFFKRSGITIGIFFLYSMIIETFVAKAANWALDTDLGNYMPLQSTDELLPFQLADMIRAIAQIPSGPPAWTFVLASFAWLIIYYVAGRAKLMRSDW
jgi:ABC-2 type transport system permease protein